MKNTFKSTSYLERARKKFFFLGLTVISSLALLAFKVSSYDYNNIPESKVIIEDETFMFAMELPEPSFTKQKKAAQQIATSTERYTIVDTPEIITMKIDLDSNDLGLVDLGDEDGDPDGDVNDDDVVIKLQQTFDWTRLSRTPYFDECENIQDRPAEAKCTYERIRIMVQQNTNFPMRPRELGLSGKVYVKFVIDNNGKVVNVENLSLDAHEDFIREAIRGVNSLPQMNPGTNRNRPVNVTLTIPVNFNLR